MPRYLWMSLIASLGFSLTLMCPPSRNAVVAQETVKMPISRAEGRTLLAQVVRWGCQYQNIDVLDIAASPLDLIVIDPILDGVTRRHADQNDVAGLQRKPDGGRQLVFAYLSIGAAEEYRPYWNPRWLVDKPTWLGNQDPNWPRSHSVRYWHPDWERIVADGLGRIVAAGFDGAFLDRVDAYGDWRGAHPGAVDDMADLVIRLADSARMLRPGFLLISQNAEVLLALDRYKVVIDGVSKESLLTGLQGEGTANRRDQIAWSMNYLSQAQKAGLTVLAIEYLKEPLAVAAARQRHRAMGFIPFVGDRLLDRLP